MARCHVTVDKLVKYSAGARAAGSLARWRLLVRARAPLRSEHQTPQSSSMMRLFLKLGRWCNLDETRAIS